MVYVKKVVRLEVFVKCKCCQQLHLLEEAATNYFLSQQESQLGLLSGCSSKHLLRIAEIVLRSFTPDFYFFLHF